MYYMSVHLLIYYMHTLQRESLASKITWNGLIGLTCSIAIVCVCGLVVECFLHAGQGW